MTTNYKLLFTICGLFYLNSNQMLNLSKSIWNDVNPAHYPSFIYHETKKIMDRTEGYLILQNSCCTLTI